MAEPAMADRGGAAVAWPSLPAAAVWTDRCGTAVAWACGLLGVLLPLSIVGYLLVKGAGVVSWRFLTDIPRGFPLGSAGGIWPAIQGTLALTGIGLLTAFPAGVAGAIFLSEYGRTGWMSKTFRFGAECLAAVPTIVYGLFGYAFLVVDLRLQVSLLAGGLTLGMLMFPIVLIGAQEALQAVEWSFRESALSLGVSRWYVIRRILLPKAWPGILAATVLAAGHAVGSAAAVLFTASVYFTRGGLELGHPVMTLPTHLYFLVAEAVSFDQAYGTALVLIVGLLLANGTALLARKWSVSR